jgi:hypothetical protein
MSEYFEMMEQLTKKHLRELLCLGSREEMLEYFLVENELTYGELKEAVRMYKALNEKRP